MNDDSMMDERSKTIEDLSKDELLTLFSRIKIQTLQIANEKKRALHELETCKTERDDIKMKAQQVVLRCKDLEERLRLMEARERTYQSEVDALVRARASNDTSAAPLISELEWKLSMAHDELSKHKMTLDKAVPKLKELKVSLETKNMEIDHLRAENHALRLKIDEVSAAPKSTQVEDDEENSRRNVSWAELKVS